MKQKKILVLEDDRLTRTVICDILKYAGYEVISTHDAAAAVRLAREEKPDLITLDIVLGAASPSDLNDGLKVGAWLNRLAGESGKPKFIIISSLNPKDVTAGIAATHPHKFLPKPVEKTTLLAAVEAALGEPSA